MAQEKWNVKLTVISWHLFIVYLINVFIAIANTFIESNWLSSLHKVLKLVNFPLYIVSITSLILSIIGVTKVKNKKNIITLGYSFCLLLLEVFVVRVFFLYLNIIYL